MLYGANVFDCSSRNTIHTTTVLPEYTALDAVAKLRKRIMKVVNKIQLYRLIH
jgi:hypothetical protein